MRDIRLTGEKPPEASFPALNPGNKKFNSRLVSPIMLQWHSIRVAVVLSFVLEQE